MENIRGTVLIAVKKEHRRYALRMCWSFERRGLNTKLVTDVPSLLAAERELAPRVIILDAEIVKPMTKSILANLHDRPGASGPKLILLNIPAGEEPEIRERWPDVEIIV